MLVEEELKKLKEENEQLKKMNEIKSDWLSISAHQLRTSLSAIKWILRMFIDKDFGVLTPEQDGFIKKAADSTDRMLELVNEMLSLNHVAETSLKYNFEKTSIVGLIDKVLFDFTGESYKKGVEIINLKNDEVIPDVAFDLEKIRVVIQNLIENAIKYSDRGGRIIISVYKREQFIEVSIKDTGIGIPPEAQEHIFEKFFRATNAQKKDTIGSGLGLFTTKSIVERHGGKMWFISKPGEGTTFSFSLPLQR